jgi:hypothetical protein
MLLLYLCMILKRMIVLIYLCIVLNMLRQCGSINTIESVGKMVHVVDSKHN